VTEENRFLSSKEERVGRGLDYTSGEKRINADHYTIPVPFTATMHSGKDKLALSFIYLF
jgi:hypothetical protein